MKREQTTATNNGVESVVENNYPDSWEQSSSEKIQSNMNDNEENTFVEKEWISNGLENFGVEGETAPDLFSSDSKTTETEGLLPTKDSENNFEDDDLEIPAFLRRQKN